MYTKAYVGIYSAVTKRFTRAAPERSIKVYKANPYTKKFPIVFS